MFKQINLYFALGFLTTLWNITSISIHIGLDSLNNILNYEFLPELFTLRQDLLLRFYF